MRENNALIAAFAAGGRLTAEERVAVIRALAAWEATDPDRQMHHPAVRRLPGWRQVELGRSLFTGSLSNLSREEADLLRRAQAAIHDPRALLETTKELK